MYIYIFSNRYLAILLYARSTTKESQSNDSRLLPCLAVEPHPTSVECSPSSYGRGTPSVALACGTIKAPTGTIAATNRH